MGCENGVIDLTLGIFREGRPDDYVSKSTGLHFREYSGTEPEVFDFEEVMHKLYPVEDIRTLVYDVWSMAFSGRNTQKFLVVSTGPKNAGKTAIHDLFKQSLGDYAIKSGPELIHKNNRNNSGGARPELMRLDGTRANIFDEISRQDIDPDMVKRLTGNETQWGRGLHDNDGKEIRPTCVTFLQTNFPPRFPADDDALWMRIIIIAHISQFLFTDFSENEQEQWENRKFKADVTFIEKFDRLAPVFLWKLFHNYLDRKERGVDCIEIPQKVKDDTNFYRTTNDAFTEFVTEHMEQMPKPKPGHDVGASDSWFASVEELLDNFRPWYDKNWSKYPVKREVFVREMTRVLGQKPEGKTKLWKGWRLDQDLTIPMRMDKTKAH